MPGTPPGSLRACSRFRLRRSSPGRVLSDPSSVRPVCPDSGRRSSGSEALRSPSIRLRYRLTFNHLSRSLPAPQLLISIWGPENSVHDERLSIKMLQSCNPLLHAEKHSPHIQHYLPGKYFLTAPYADRPPSIRRHYSLVRSISVQFCNEIVFYTSKYPESS